MKFFDELKRRNVIKETLAYLALSWVLLQVGSIILPLFNAPDWVLKTITFFLAIGLPVWILFSWAYQITPDGVKKTAKIVDEVPHTTVTNKRLNVLIIITLVIVIAVSFINKPNLHTGDIDKSIAVLPFLDLSQNKDQEYFSDGIALDILNLLCKFEGLNVAARTSSFSFKNKNEDLKTIGEKLNVTNILEGDFRKINDKIIITVRLTDAVNGYSILSETYTDEMQNIFALQSKIVVDIADKIELKLSLKGKQLLNRKKIKPIAYENYQKGRSQFINGPLNMLPGEINAAKKYFNTAVKQDPSFAEAHAYLSITYYNLADWAIPKDDKLNIAIALDSAQFLAKRALLLDSLNSAARLAMGSYYFHQYDWVKSEQEKRKAVELNPGGTEEKVILASFLGQFGQAEEALRLDEEAMRLDPLDLGNKLDYARDLFRARKFDEGILHCNLILEENPNLSGAYQFLWLCYLGEKKFPKASNALIHYFELTGNHELAEIYRKSDYKTATKNIIFSHKESDLPILQSNIFLALLFATLEDKENTLKYLNLMYDNSETQISFLSQFQFDFLRNDSEYFILYEKAGFKAYDEYKKVM